MKSLYFHKKNKILHSKLRSLVFILCMPLMSCFNNEKIEGERLDLYQLEMDTHLNKSGKSINLSNQKSIKSLSQVDNGPTHLSVHSKFNSPLIKSWEVSLINKGLISAPVFSKEHIYILDSRANLYSFSLNGKKEWVLDLAPISEKNQKTHHSGGIALNKGNLFVATGFGEFFSININGTINWKKRFDSPFRGAPIFSNNKIFVLNADDLAIALNKNGEILWTLQGATRPTLLSKGVSPSIKSNKLLLPFSAGQLNAVRPNNGSQLWKVAFDQSNKGEAYSIIGDFGGSPVIKSNKVFIVSSSGQFLALNLNSGRKIWSVLVGSNSTPVIDGGSIFLVSTKGKLVRIVENNGEVVWSRNISGSTSSNKKFFGPTLAGNFLWVTGTDGYLRKFDPSTGKEFSKHRIGHQILYRTYAVHDKLFIITRSGKIIAFD